MLKYYEQCLILAKRTYLLFNTLYDKKIFRIFAFLKRYIKHPLYIIVYASVYFLKGFAFKVKFYSNNEIINLLQKGKSVIRLGDGDIVHIQLALDNTYHRPDQRLKKMYKTIIKNYHEGGSYVLSIPRFVNYTNLELKNLGERKLEWGLAMKVMFFLVSIKIVHIWTLTILLRQLFRANNSASFCEQKSYFYYK